MPKVKAPVEPTHRAVLATGETVDYAGAHPTHWSFGGVDNEGKKDGSPVRVVPVVSTFPLHIRADADPDDWEGVEDE